MYIRQPSLFNSTAPACRMTDEKNPGIVRSYSLQTSVSKAVFKDRKTEKDGDNGENYNDTKKGEMNEMG